MAKLKPLPKSMGACADLYFAARTARLAADKHAADLKAEETRIANHIIDNMPKDSTGAAGKSHRVQVVTKKKLRVVPEKWNDFYAWVAKNKAWDVLQKRISDKAIEERLQSPRPPKIPGVETFNAVTVSLTKI